jgi:hypothetical protein
MAIDTKKFFGDVELKSAVKLTAQTGSRAMTIDGSGNLVSSATTDTELGFLSGVSSSIQSQLNDKIASSEKGTANGVATLGAGGKIPSSQIPAIAITEVFVAADIAARDALTIGSGDGEIQEGDVVVVTDASADPAVSSGAASYIYDGSGYQRLLTPDAPVQSVNGASGVVVLDTDDINEGATNKYYASSLFDADLATKDTDDLTEGATNKYYASSLFDADLATKDTDDLTEGASNKYYSSTLFDSDFSGKSSADLNHTQNDAADWTVADGSSIGAHLDEIGDRLVTLEAGSTDQKDLKVSANDTTAGFLEDKIVVSSGSNTTDILEVSTLNDAGDEDLQIQIDESKIDHDALLNFVANEHIDWTVDAGQDIADENISESSVTQHVAAIDHDSLLNFVANEHVDHTSVSVVAGGQDGLSVSNDDLSSNIGLSVDITGTSAAASIEGADEVMIHDDSAGSLAKTTIADIRKSSAGDILETAFAGAQSASSASVTGFAFANATVRSFTALVHVEVDATADLFEVFTLEGIQRGSDWVMSVSSTGDDSSVTFDINSSGQIVYSSSTYAGFASMDITFRAITTSV